MTARIWLLTHRAQNTWNNGALSTVCKAQGEGLRTQMSDLLGKQGCALTSRVPLRCLSAPRAHCRRHSPCLMHSEPVHTASTAPAPQHTPDHKPRPLPHPSVSLHLSAHTSTSPPLPQIPASLQPQPVFPAHLRPTRPSPPSTVEVPTPPAANPDGCHPVCASQLTPQPRSETTRPLTPNHGPNSHPHRTAPLPAPPPLGHPPPLCRAAAHSGTRPAWGPARTADKARPHGSGRPRTSPSHLHSPQGPHLPPPTARGAPRSAVPAHPAARRALRGAEHPPPPPPARPHPSLGPLIPAGLRGPTHHSRGAAGEPQRGAGGGERGGSRRILRSLGPRRRQRGVSLRSRHGNGERCARGAEGGGKLRGRRPGGLRPAPRRPRCRCRTLRAPGAPRPLRAPRASERVFCAPPIACAPSPQPRPPLTAISPNPRPDPGPTRPGDSGSPGAPVGAGQRSFRDGPLCSGEPGVGKWVLSAATATAPQHNPQHSPTTLPCSHSRSTGTNPSALTPQQSSGTD